MGNYNTKNEEIIVAQSGANQQVDDIKVKVEFYGVMLIVGAVCFILLVLCLCGRGCCRRVKKYCDRQVSDMLSSVVISNQPASKGVRADPSANLPTKQVPIEPIESFDVTTHETEKTTTITLPTTTRIETAADIDAITSNPDKATRTDEKISTTPPPNSTSVTPRPAPEPGILTRVYRIIKDQIRIFIHTPKVSSVMKNIATCVVNGAMELITYYFPTPLIPIIASAAGMLIPFEPVLMLRDRVPVTSYRRAFLTAMNSFLGTFDKYKLEDNNEYDPYMTQRFNRRMMNFGSAEKKKSKGFQ